MCPNGTGLSTHTIPKTAISVKPGFGLANPRRKSIIVKHGELYLKVKMAEKNMIAMWQDYWILE
jgi:hypothetical protein